MIRLALLLALLSACEAAPEDTGQVVLESGVAGVDCFTCNRGLDDPTCDPCADCRARRGSPTPPVAVSGCLPVGQWCGEPLAVTCKVVTCSTCAP